MDAFLGPAFQYAAMGAVMGGCLGGLAEALKARKVPVKVEYIHPTKKKPRVLYTFGLCQEIPAMLERLWGILRIDPSIDQNATKQMHVICHRAQRYFVLWREHLRCPNELRPRLELRDQGTRLMTSLGHMENVVWSGREVEEVMRIVHHIQGLITTTLLLLDQGR
jgi:hypothetical protein